jgi:hypothetical protein
MRVSTIVACLVLVSTPTALACDGHGAAQTGWLQETPSSDRYFAGETAEETTTLAVSLVGAGAAALALVVFAFRIMTRASGGRRVGPTEFEPAAPEESPTPIERPGDPWIRIDAGHERPEPIGIGRDEEALSGVHEMH